MDVHRHPACPELVFDDAQLARHARTALSAAGDGMLVLGMTAGAPQHGYRVVLADDDGEALIVCRRDGAIDRASATRQLSHVTIEPYSVTSVQLRLGGRLRPAAVDGRSVQQLRTGHDLTIVSLCVERIEVACPHRCGRLGRERRQIPLELYALSHPDTYAVERYRLVRHMNSHHQLALRRVAARVAHAELADVAAATIARLDPCRATLTCINAAGAHELVIDFPERANTITELIVMLRSHFLGAARTT